MNQTSLLTLAAALTGSLLASSAHAHIDIIGEIKARGGDQKAWPCDGDRSAGPTYTYEPGTTIAISVSEGIPHPGYFRIAFDKDGQAGFTDPRSISPVDKGRACPYNADDQCGADKSDFCNNETVLWDNLNPHTQLEGVLASYTWNIKLPDVECDNCTLQVIQVMEDTLGHGAYCPFDTCKEKVPDLFGNVQDIYHRCINIKLAKGAKNSVGTTTAAVANGKGAIECAKMAPPADPAKPTNPEPPPEMSSDAGMSVDPETPSDDKPADDEPSDDKPADDQPSDDDTASETGSKQDAGTKKDAGSKNGAGTKKDGGTSSDERDEDGEYAASSSESGCALSGSANDMSTFGVLLALGYLARRRRRTL